MDLIAPTNEEEVLAAEWEKIRHKFAQDTRTIERLEVYTGKGLGREQTA
jgi:hypothetical protein